MNSQSLSKTDKSKSTKSKKSEKKRPKKRCCISDILYKKISYAKDTYDDQVLSDELSYRIPKKITETFTYRSEGEYFSSPICPTCKISFEREFQKFCDRCGQKLDWEGFSYATCINRYPPYQPFKKH